MSIEVSESGGWRCAAQLGLGDSDGSHVVAVELDRNFGGMWPRIVVEATVAPAASTTIRIDAVEASGADFEGFSGKTYLRGLSQELVSALAKGVATGLAKSPSVEIEITSGGMAVDTAEAVAERAAEVATKLLLARLGEARSLDAILSECVESWSS